MMQVAVHGRKGSPSVSLPKTETDMTYVLLWVLDCDQLYILEQVTPRVQLLAEMMSAFLA